MTTAQASMLRPATSHHSQDLNASSAASTTEFTQPTLGSASAAKPFATQELMLSYIAQFLKTLRSSSVDCVFQSYTQALQQLASLPHTSVMLRGIDAEEVELIVHRLLSFSEKMSDWFSMRLADSKLNCCGLTHDHIDAVTNRGLDQLLTASEADLALQMDMQQSFDVALQQFKSMLINAGFRTETDLLKLPIARDLYRTNPVNLSKLLLPIVDKLAEKKPIDWIFYRLLHTSLYHRLPELYKSWEKSLRNYHSMLRTYQQHK